MNRRSALSWLSGTLTAWINALGFGAAAQQKATPSPNPEVAEWARKAAEMRAASIAAIPYERIETTGTEALATWERLRSEGRGWPIIVGGDEDLARVADQLGIEDKTDPAAVLAAAAKLTYPADLRKLRERERVEGAEAESKWAAGPDAHLPEVTELDRDGKARTVPPAEVRERMLKEADAGDPPVGDWPATPPSSGPMPSVARALDGKPLVKVHILLLPTAESAAAPAYLKWGGWNACPAPEYHVAALRSWHERYGAEIVSMSGDVINLRVKRRPQSRAEALALAREQYLYCEDIILQGTEALAPLASSLMKDDWWFFWWD